jgi:hypothetical protein
MTAAVALKRRKSSPKTTTKTHASPYCGLREKVESFESKGCLGFITPIF